MNRPLISLTTDFGVQTQGIGCMKGSILLINPDAHIVDLMHGIPDFDLSFAARTMETAQYLPVGHHVCVVDPGVGTERKSIIIKCKRGDYLIGPDNGCLITAPRFLDGIEKIVKIENEKYMRHPISPIFHGRDVYAPAAAHLSLGVNMDEFGPELKKEELRKAPYEEAVLEDGVLKTQVISINKFGSMHLNVVHAQWDEFAKVGDKVVLEFNNQKAEMPVVNTFGEVPEGELLILKDDYGRIGASINLGRFVDKYPVKISDKVIVKKI